MLYTTPTFPPAVGGVEAGSSSWYRLPDCYWWSGFARMHLPGGTRQDRRQKHCERAVASSKKASGDKPAKRGAGRKAVASSGADTPSIQSDDTATSATSAKVNKTSEKPKKSSIATRTDSKSVPVDPGHLQDQEWLKSQREALISERAKYTVSAERLAAEAAALMADREPGDVQFDEESGEGDTIAVERDRDLALSAAARQAIDDIDNAMQRLDKGVYGLCIAGDDVIPKERLEAIPEAAVCVQHKTSMF